MKKYIKALKYKILHNKKDKFSEKKFLCGKQLLTYPGTIRNNLDQDDTWYFYLAKHNDIIFDIGCNIGYTALLAMIQNPDRKYLLVDPNTKALAVANRNLTINNLGMKSYYNSCFVSDKNDENIEFFTIGLGEAGSMNKSHATTAAQLKSSFFVKTVTLDFLYNYYKIKPNLVKIDVEGAELLAIKGATKLANEAKCLFFVEMHTLPDMTMEDSGNEVLKWCNENKYNVWFLRDKKKLDDGKLIKDMGKCHLLLVPQEQPFPEYLNSIAPGSPLPNLK